MLAFLRSLIFITKTENVRFIELQNGLFFLDYDMYY